jgi:hypothetical protein
MRIVPFPRRHRALWIIAAVVGFAAWGSWLASTGRATDYGSGFAHVPFAATAAASVSPAPSVPRLVEPPMTSPAAVPQPAAAPASAEAARPGAPAGPSTREPSGTAVAGGPVSAGLAGMTDPPAFARAVTDTVLAYPAGQDRTARVDAVMAVAALPPIGSPQELAADLGRLAPAPALTASGATVSFSPDAVIPSAWAASRIEQLRLPPGSFAIDVTGSQVVTVPGHDPVTVPVTIGITGACPPALVQCEIDRIFPRTVAEELGS